MNWRLKLAWWLIGRADKLLPVAARRSRLDLASERLRVAETLIAEHLDGYPEEW